VQLRLRFIVDWGRTAEAVSKTASLSGDSLSNYWISAELPGFQTQTFTDVQLGGAQQVRLNFTLQVAAAAGTNVEVTVAADTTLPRHRIPSVLSFPNSRSANFRLSPANVFNLVQNMPAYKGTPEEHSATWRAADSAT
jgi:hypothetical protein